MELYQLTEQEAIEKVASRWWVGIDADNICEFQLYQGRLCMPFELFHKAVEEALGRPVWTHEFADQRALQEEFEGKIPKADMTDVLAKLQKFGKPIIVVSDDAR